MTKLLLLLPILLTPACTSGTPGDGLVPADVFEIPSGDAVGAAASGEYDLETYTTACLGNCSPVRIGLSLVSLCDVGDTDYPGVDVTQNDGKLAMITFGIFPDRLDGALDASGTFTVGGAGTRYDVPFVLLATGTLLADELVGTVESRTYGTIDGQSFDCTAVAELTGVRAVR
jgi:hypothetical protein